MAGTTIVVGAGIVGLAFAREAARRGRQVTLFERDRLCQGASVRNFGMIWPIGQPAGPRYQRALRSRDLWLDVARQAGIWIEPCGSLHLAYHPKEWAVLEEFLALNPFPESQLQLWTPQEIHRRYPKIRTEGLLGGLRSESECVVDSPRAIRALAQHLLQDHGVAVQFQRTVARVEMPNVWLTTGERFQADEVLICAGQDHAWLFPNDFQQSGLKLCKLQMFASNQYRQERIGTHLAGGLTLCHYEAFQSCHSLVALKNHYQETHADYLRHGIHVMVSQNESNELVLGDSHHYGDEIYFDQSEAVDELILSYLNQMLPVERASITRRWFGIYAKHPTQSLYTSEVQPGCYILSGLGGAGMTLSLGHAEAWWNTYAGA